MSYLEMHAITKEFPGVIANDRVDLVVEQGEIHALIGENGAGKSTLMNILYGMNTPDSGTIRLDGQLIKIPSPQTAIQLGIGMVHQHFQLIPSLTVAENVSLGYETVHWGFLDHHAMLERVTELAERFGLDVNPHAVVQDLPVGIQQRVEILKLLYRNAKLLILDEPSAVLTPQEVQSLFGIIRQLVAVGHTAIFITHKLNEVMQICDRATVLRRGKVVGSLDIAETTPDEIARLMVGADIETITRTGQHNHGETKISIDDLNVKSDQGVMVLRSLSFELYAGEILGVAGVEGNGQQELLETLIGLRKPISGNIVLDQQSITYFNTRQRRRMGLAIIPEDRNHQGLSGDLSIWENMIVTNYDHKPQSQNGILNLSGICQAVNDLISRFDIRTHDQDVKVGTLSGGNAQKVIIAREINANPSVLIAAQPTRGLDIGAAHFVHEQLLDMRDKDMGVLLFSADLDELLSICDRFVVMYAGKIVGTLTVNEATREKLGLLMAGQSIAESVSTS